MAKQSPGVRYPTGGGHALLSGRGRPTIMPNRRERGLSRSHDSRNCAYHASRAQASVPYGRLTSATCPMIDAKSVFFARHRMIGDEILRCAQDDDNCWIWRGRLLRCARSNYVECQEQTGLNSSPFLSIALRIVSILCIQATNATFFSFPPASKRS